MDYLHGVMQFFYESSLHIIAGALLFVAGGLMIVKEVMKARKDK